MSFVLFAYIYNTVLLVLFLFSEKRLNASPIGNRGGEEIVCSSRTDPMNGAKRWALISRDLWQWLNREVTESSFLSVTVTICSLWCGEPSVECLMLHLTNFGGSVLLTPFFWVKQFNCVKSMCILNKLLLSRSAFWHSF